MNKLITLTGDSGCGKTDLIRLINEYHGNHISVIKKYTDRDLRPGEENAIEIKSGCPTEYVKTMDHVYTNYDKKYGFSKKSIEDIFKQGNSPIVIIGNEDMLIRLCHEYAGRICPIYIQRDMTDLDFIEELRRDKRTEEQIRQRIDSRHQSSELWRRRANLFGYRYIINGQFLDEKGLLGWFETIAMENEIDIENPINADRVRGIINYFRSLWKGRPAIRTLKVGSEPIIEEQTEDNQR